MSSAAATAPRSAQFLLAPERPSLAQVRLLRRWAGMDYDEHQRLRTLLSDGVGHKDKARAGILCYALGHYADAEEHLDAKDAYCQAVLGMMQMELGDLNEAKALFTSAAKSIPEAKSELVRVLTAQGAGEDAERAVAAVVDPAERAFVTGLTLEIKHRIEAAIKSYEAALEAAPQHAEAAFKLGVLLDRIGDDELAAEQYLVCADVYPAYIPGVINLGILYDERGEPNAAIDCFRQALAWNPRDRRARGLLRDARASRQMYYDEKEEREREKMDKVMRTSVNDFELSVRSRNCLAKMNIFTLGDLLRISEPEMLAYKNFGETSLKEVKEMLANRNLRLGMYKEVEEKIVAKADHKVLAESIERLELSPKSAHVLDSIGVTRIGDLAQYSDLDLYRTPGAGQSFAQELATALGAYGVVMRKPEVKG